MEIIEQVARAAPTIVALVLAVVMAVAGLASSREHRAETISLMERLAPILGEGGTIEPSQRALPFLVDVMERLGEENKKQAERITRLSAEVWAQSDMTETVRKELNIVRDQLERVTEERDGALKRALAAERRVTDLTDEVKRLEARVAVVEQGGGTP